MPFISRAFLLSFLPLGAFEVAQQRQLADDAARYVASEIMLAPLHLRFALSIAVSLFSLWVFCLSWRLSAAEAAALFETLGGSPVRNITRLIRSLALLHVAENPLVLHALGTATVPERQNHYRALYGAGRAA